MSMRAGSTLVWSQRSGLGCWSRFPRAHGAGSPQTLAPPRPPAPGPSRAVVAPVLRGRASSRHPWRRGCRSWGPLGPSVPSGPCTDHRRNTKASSRKGYRGGVHKQTQIMLQLTRQEPGSEQPIRKDWETSRSREQKP